jgi:hypothetical protein
MNYYAAREIEREGRPTGLYHYTVENSGGIHPVGYCSSYRTCPACNGHALMGMPCVQCDRSVIKVEPCPGHPTKEEAEEHYRQYELDRATFDGRHEDQQNRCAVCGVWTQRYATFRMHVYHLCDVHCNREALDVLTRGDTGDMISSV